MTLAPMAMIARIVCLIVVTGVAPAAGSADRPPALSEADFRAFDPARAALGRLLFYDKILSGNRNIACGTCHNHDLATGDGLSLGIGEGGAGLGPNRVFATGAGRPDARVPRNANPLFNLGHRSITEMFHDGRVSAEDVYGRGFNTPAEEWLPLGLQSVVAAQALFPLTADVEMAGQPEENDVAAARNKRLDLVWPVVAARVAAIPAYADRFARGFDDVSGPGDITAVHIANAIDDFINSEWRATGSAFDRYLAGDTAALSPQARRGMDVFFGPGGCAACHNGPLLSDQKYHALAVPPLGPGRTRRFDPSVRDVGRMAETDLLADAYRFRTPMLRNVAHTGPWGHNGAFATLEAVVRHHLDPVAGLTAWDRTQVILPADAAFAETDFAIWEDNRTMAHLRRSVDIDTVTLREDQIADLVAFLSALSDPAALAGRLGKPTTVPSGLPVD